MDKSNYSKPSSDPEERGQPSETVPKTGASEKNDDDVQRKKGEDSSRAAISEPSNSTAAPAAAATGTTQADETTTTTTKLKRIEEPLPSNGTVDALMVVADDDANGGTTTTSNKPAPKSPPAPNSNKNKSPAFIPAATTPGDRCTGRVRLGICAMDKKARSKPMAEILSRLDEDLFGVVFFGDDTILNQPIEEWPECDVLVAFFSKGFPLKKAQDYVALRRPFVLNDLNMQETLQDRRKVYDLLEASGIDTPRHVFLSRDGYVSSGTGDGNGARDQVVQEFDDHIEVNGVTMNKPFVEKPVDAEDHNIAIYYPTSAGGGCKKLFRKVGNRSSEFYPNINEVRQGGSWIYEEFVETQGTDVKMYTVGPEYGHAEARKSPTVDGKVERNSDGKEIRFPVILTFREKEIARRIVLGFKQWICGFDILRVQEGHSVVSYVCDVNGFSFVKNSRKYYDDCAQILSEHLLALVKPAALKTFSTLDPLVTVSLDRLDIAIEEKKGETFLSRAARMLQGGGPEDHDDEDDDRSWTSRGTTGNRSRADSTDTSVAATTLEKGAKPVRDFPGNLTSEPASICQSASSSVAEDEDDAKVRSIPSASSIRGCHQEELRCVLAIIRHADRTPKQKLKTYLSEPHILKYFHDHTKDPKKDLKVKAKAPMIEFLRTVKTTLVELERIPENESLRYELMHMRDILERWKITGLNRKLQIKPKKWETVTTEDGETKERCTEVQLVLKWGGNLTRLGEKQAINLGQRLRTEMYPDSSGGGILRLHSTFRHDLKIKTSDEGRVIKTAGAFAKGLLELEGDLPPILISLVHKEKGSMHMLDPSGNKEVKLELDECKEKITANLQKDIDIATASEEELEQLVGPKEIVSLRNAVELLGNPRKALKQIHQLMGDLISQLEEMLGAMGSGDEAQFEGGEGLKGDAEKDFVLSGVSLYKGETLLELTERWRFIYNRLYDEETDTFDLSRIPDVHDNVRFDVLHNPHLGLTDTLHRLYDLAKKFADTVVPQEYGTTILEKRSVGLKICHGLLEKIKFDLGYSRQDKNQADIRYMINMDYSADLPINTMGRRIRTRLYFTSESHLHTVLNVLRFANGDNGNPILSQNGINIINSTPELCYLTQIVMRVFEDSRPEMRDNSKRFRVEILFSPGATATPFHLDEANRDSDLSRLDTAPLQMIGRDSLTCQELEEFFEEAIMAGRADEECSEPPPSVSTMPNAPGIPKSPSRKKEGKVNGGDFLTTKKTWKPPLSREASIFSVPTFAVPEDTTENAVGETEGEEEAAKEKEIEAPNEHDELVNKGAGKMVERSGAANEDNRWDGDKPDDFEDDDESVDTMTSEIVRRVVARKHFWTAVAVGSFVVGASCLLFAMRMADDTRHKPTRRYTRIG